MEKPRCELGYPIDQVEEILGDRFEEFGKWVSGQTMAICDGYLFNYAADEYEPTHCGPHGQAIYPWDLQRFLDRRPVID